LIENALGALKNDYEFRGYSTELELKRIIKDILTWAKPTTRVFILNAAEYVEDAGIPAVAERSVSYNRWIAEAVSFLPNVTILNILDYVEDSREVLSHYHFSRLVYFRLFEHVRSLLSGVPHRRQSWAFHQLSDPVSALSQSVDAPTL